MSAIMDARFLEEEFLEQLSDDLEGALCVIARVVNSREDTTRRYIRRAQREIKGQYDSFIPYVMPSARNDHILEAYDFLLSIDPEDPLADIREECEYCLSNHILEPHYEEDEEAPYDPFESFFETRDREA